MATISDNNRRIAKNSVFLYFRMFLGMLVGLYTSRVIINALGVEDYGIFSVVAGTVVMFEFLQSAMRGATQRYLTFELGRGNRERLNMVFMTSMYIHLIIAGIVILLAETVGLWLVLHKLVIPAERMTAALWCYQLAIFGSALAVVNFPYNAAIIAHEHMHYFAYLSILEQVLKLLICYMLYVGGFDRLILYSCLNIGVTILLMIIRVIYSRKHFSETHFRKLFDKSLLKEMGSFLSWNFVGHTANVIFSQGITIMLNMFFGPVVNAAEKIASTVNGHAQQFSGGFLSAVNPQITKTYAQHDLAEHHKLIYRSSKFSNYLIFIAVLPLMLETQPIFVAWLKTVPENTAAFAQIALLIGLMSAMFGPIATANSATGKIKLYHLMHFVILVLGVGIIYAVLRLTKDPVLAYWVQLVVMVVTFTARTIYVSRQIKMPLREFLAKVIVPCLLVDAVACIVPVALRLTLPQNVWTILLIIVVSVVSVCAAAYWLGLTNSERIFVNETLRNRVGKVFRTQK